MSVGGGWDDRGMKKVLTCSLSLAVMVVAMLAALPVEAATASTYVVGSGGTAPAGAIRVADASAVPWSKLAPGSKVLFASGHFVGPVTITATGTKAAPIVVDRLGSAAPVIDNSVDLQHSSWVTLRHLTVAKATWAGFIVRNGSNHVTIAGNTVTDSYMGVNVSAGAGAGIAITGNTIARSATDGIGLNEVNATASDPSVISGNTISASGDHGIEIQTSGWTITHNVIHDSGEAIGGTSGIHLYSDGASENVGDHNTITYNTSYDNHDTSLYDGNGIEVDQWCDDNTVSFNLTYGNDGAGIIVYDGAGNTITSNTAVNNARRTRAGYRGDILVTSQGDGTVDRTAGNTVRDNLVSENQQGVDAMFVDWLTADNTNVLGPNLLWNSAGTVALQIGSATASTSAAADTITAVRGNLVAAPPFVNSGAPLTGGDALKAYPGLPGVPTAAGTPDLAGATPSAGVSYFGAYYSPRKK